MPKLSELIATGAPAPSVYGIVVDTDDVTPPEGLKEAGVLATIDGGDISDAVLDAAISWSLAGIEVTVEVPAEADLQDAPRLLATCAAVGLSLSALPPSEDGEEAFEAWCARVEALAKAYVSQANMSKFVYPVTSYLGYMFIEACSPEAASRFVPTDGYVKDAFHDRVGTEKADLMKARLRAAIVDAYGGEEGFLSFARALMGTIYRRVEEGCVEEARRLSGGTSPAA